MWESRSNRTTLYTLQALVASFAVLLLAGCSSSTPIPPTATDSETTERGVETGVDELDRAIQIVLDGDMNALRSLIRYTEAECTFEDGLGGPPKCEEGEDEGETVEVLPFLGPEGHFIRRDDINSWTGIDASDLYAVYSVSGSAFSDPIYPSGEYAIAFINEARFLITTLQIVEGNIVRVDSHMGNPPEIRLDDVDIYLIPPLELDQ
jgi:outer membrane murein-binding lipoprotein Lpp